MNVDPPYEFIAQGLIAGEVIPFFGAAASAVYRPRNESWEPGKPFMPFGAELATSLASAAKYPVADMAFKAAFSDLLQAVQGILPNISVEQLEAALDPLVRKYIGAPPPLAVVASWAEH